MWGKKRTMNLEGFKVMKPSDEPTTLQNPDTDSFNIRIFDLVCNFYCIISPLNIHCSEKLLQQPCTLGSCDHLFWQVTNCASPAVLTPHESRGPSWGCCPMLNVLLCTFYCLGCPSPNHLGILARNLPESSSALLETCPYLQNAP